MFTWIRGLAVAGLIVLPALASADPIGPNCTTCDGGIYTLSWSGTPQSTTLTTETDRITLTIDTSGVSAFLTGLGGGLVAPFALDAAAIKIASSVISATLFAAPGGTGNWNLIPGGINAGGCSGSGGGFDCADWVGAGPGTALGGILTFVFDETITLGTALTGPLAASIKARYVDSLGNKSGALVSEKITLQTASSGTSSTGISSTGNTPEPGSSSLAVLGLGLLAASFWARRKA